MSALRLIVLLVWAACLGCGSAQAEKRVALVVGNSAYKSVPRLANPASDAALIGGMLKSAGFDTVDVRQDLNAVEMRRALREFGARARDADVAVVYYAGHGIEVDGNNYLIPTDAVLETDTDVYDEAFPLDRVLVTIEPAKQLRLVILDACRDNPFAKTMKRTVASRAIGRGLAKVEPTSPNTMIAFAAKAGSTASDGDTRNSPFATALADYLPKPGLDLRKAFGFVRDEVLKKTGYKQEPYIYGSLGGDDMPLVPAAAATPQGSAQANPQDAVRRDYELALQIGTREVWTAFLGQYPDGFYASLAKGQLNRIAAEAARAAPEKTQQAEGERAKKADANKPADDNAADAPAGKQATDKPGTEQKIAAVAPTSAQPTMPDQDVTRQVQLELRRVGCHPAPTDGLWTSSSERSLSLFNRYARTKLDTKLASTDALDTIKARPGRVCPLVCEPGFKPDGEQCVKITCRTGQVLNDNGDCVRRKDEPSAAKPEQSKPSKPDVTTASKPDIKEQGGQRGGRCTSISQRCAVQIGGRCNPATGHWEYGRNGAGGDTQSFNTCIGRMLAGGRQ